MKHEFPHLDGNEYPGVGDSLYPTHDNNFDYDRWTAGTRLHPMTVKWTERDENRVQWADDAARDAWFDARIGDVFDLSTAMDILPGGTVKLPIPMQAMTRANYLMVEVPDMPGEGDQLDNSDPHTARWHYFISDARRVTPSVTECTLTVDWYTTFQHAITMPRIDLERGHYPATLTNVADYLANPLAHTDGLTGVEPFQPADPRKVTKHTMVPLGTGDAYAVLAIKTTPERANNAMPVAQPLTTTPPTYGDTSDYWGSGWNVDEYQYGGVRDVSNIGAPKTPLAFSPDGIRPTGYALMAIKATELTNAVAVWESHPTVLRMIEACMMVPADMIALGSVIDFAGVQAHVCTTVRDKRLANIKLSPDDFAYPNRYRKLTKLYTMPYAMLEVTDEQGASTIIRIEDTTPDTGIRRFLTLAYPTLSALTFVDNVNGTGAITVTWGTMSGTTTTRLPDGVAALSKHDIPTYALWLDPVEAWNLDNHSQMVEQARDNAINTYHVTVRGANTGQTSANASADTGQTNATVSADTGQTNANASADTGQTNANASATVSETNAKNSNDTATANTKLQTDNATATVTIGNTLRSDLTRNNYVVNVTIHATNVEMSNALQEADAKAVAMTTLQGALGDIAGGAATGGLAGALGGVTAGLSSAISNVIALNATAEKTQATLKAARERIDQTNTAANAACTVTNNTNSTLTANGNTVATQTTTNNNNLNTTNTGNSATLTRENAKRTADTAKANAARSVTTAKANAVRSAATAKASAQRSRDNTVAAAQINLAQAQDQYTALIDDLNRRAPIPLAKAMGDAAPDLLGTRGVQIRVKTQTPDVVRRCGDQMLRYGYVYDCVVENPDLLLNRKFAYWQGTPLIYSNGDAPAQAVEAIRDLFEGGVTLWANGDTIGASIYKPEA